MGTNTGKARMGRTPASRADLSQLSPRQRTVVRLYGRGLAVRDIAALLRISPKTVEAHLDHSKERLGLHRRRDLILALPPLRLFVSTDHDYRYPVGVASIVLARNRRDARALLDAQLVRHGLRPHRALPYTLTELPLDLPAAYLLRDGGLAGRSA